GGVRAIDGNQVACPGGRRGKPRGRGFPAPPECCRGYETDPVDLSDEIRTPVYLACRSVFCGLLGSSRGIGCGRQCDGLANWAPRALHWTLELCRPGVRPAVSPCPAGVVEDDRSLPHGVPGRAAKRAARISGSGPDGWSLSHAGVLEDHDAVAPSHHRVRRGEWLRHRDRLV